MNVEQLMYGMMLPSGNDAAYALAEHFGTMLKDRKYQNISDAQLKVNPQSQFLTNDIKYFLKEMNFQANKLKMTSTIFDSPHGLMNKCNFSTVADVAILTAECMKIDLFRKVVGTIQYETSALSGSP